MIQHNNMTAARRGMRCAGVWSKALCTVMLFGAATNISWGQNPTNPKRDSADVKRLHAVLVTDTRAGDKTPLTTSNLNRKAIEDSRLENTLPYMLELQPSVVAAGENGKVGNTSMRVRGVDATRINVNINGVTLNDAESQMVYWVNIPNLAGMAQNVQLQRGIGAATGGTAAFGGALNLQTLNSPLDPYASADLSLGSWNTRQYGIMAGSGIGQNKLALDVAYNGLTSDGYVRGGFCDHQSLFMSGGYYGENTLLKAVVILGKQRTGITWDGAYADDLDADPTYNGAGAYYDDMGNLHYYDNESDNYEQRHYQLYFSQKLAEHWRLNLSGDYTWGEGFYEQYKYNKKLSKYGLGDDTKTDFITRKMSQADAYTLTGSLFYDTERLHFSLGAYYLDYDGDHYGNVMWVKDSNVSYNTTDKWYENIGHKKDATVYAKANYAFSSMLNGYADMQFRHVNYTLNGNDDDFSPLAFEENYNFFNPKMGLNMNFMTRAESASPLHHQLYWVAGISHREPSRADIKDALESPTGIDTVEAEAMLDIEAGWRVGTTRWSFAANAYAMLYQNQLTASGKISNSGYAIMINVDKSYRLGIELEGGYRFCRWFDLAGNLTLSANKVLDYQYNDSVNLGTTDLSYSPNVVGAAIATFRPLKDAKIQLIGKYVGEMYCDNTSREEMLQDDYLVLNAKVSYLWHLGYRNAYAPESQLEAQLVVNNLLDNHYRTSAWVADYGGGYIERAFFQQPGINCAVRLVVKL